MNRHAEILLELVQYEKPLAPLLDELQSFGWNWSEDQPLLILTQPNLLKIIDRFLSGLINSVQLQQWAETLECREDVGFDEKDEKILKDVLFRLATPLIYAPLNLETVGKMKSELLGTN